MIKKIGLKKITIKKRIEKDCDKKRLKKIAKRLKKIVIKKIAK